MGVGRGLSAAGEGRQVSLPPSAEVPRGHQGESLSQVREVEMEVGPGERVSS